MAREQNADRVTKAPSDWFPWNYRRTLIYEVPFGRGVFLDLTSLPGTATFELFGYEIQLLPRGLIIDRQEYPWRAAAPSTLRPAPATPNRAQPAPQ